MRLFLSLPARRIPTFLFKVKMKDIKVDLEFKAMIFPLAEGELTQDILNELATAREKLSSHYHRDGANAPSWSTYCQDIGLEKSTVNRWLARHLKKEKAK